MDLIKRTDTKYEEYENLLLERDQLRKDAASIWISYVRTFGQLISDVYEEKLECIKCKKAIAYYQAAINHGEVVDPEAMQQYLEREMSSYYANLKKMLEENDRCRRSEQSTEYEVQRSKTLYRRLAKMLHPDINPETDRREELIELWQRIVTAYGHNDVKALAELEVLTRKVLRELGTGELKIDIPDIDDRIKDLKKEIFEITHTEPYTHRDLLANQEAVNKKTAELEAERESYQKYRKELEEVMQNLVLNGGVKYRWRMK